MLKITTRPYNNKEKDILRKQLPSLYSQIESSFLLFMWIFVAFLIPLLVWDKLQDVSPQHELHWLVFIFPISIIVTFIVLKSRKNISKTTNEEVSNGIVEVLHVLTQRAIKRKDPEDFGIAYYIDVSFENKQKTLYLWGQYLDDLEYENLFPNTEFEIVIATSNKETIDIKLLGHFFEPEKNLEPFDSSVWKKGNYPLNGEVLDITIDNIE